MKIRKPNRRAALVAAILAALAGDAAARCEAAQALPDAETFDGRRSGDDLPDRVVIAPAAHGGFRWCYWNSPMSGGDAGSLTVAGTEIAFQVRIMSGPEILTFDLPGAIATDLDGVPLRETSAPDGDEIEGLLFMGLM